VIKNWSRRHTLGAGAILILSVNAIALVGAGYNRSGEPDSRLVMTERELRPPQPWGFQTENSGMTLKLLWRLPRPELEMRGVYYDYAGYGGEAPWLDQAKLAELGFDASRSAENEDGKRHYQKLRSREVLLVLELAGPVYEAALDRARRYAEERGALAAANPRQAEIGSSAELAKKQLEREQATSSRLFIVDAGLERAMLRAKYSDRARYAIVGGRVKPTLSGGENRQKVGGYIEALNIDAVTVPLEFRPVFEGAVSIYPLAGGYTGPRYEAAVAFGRRLEPWLTAAVRTTRRD
jgi:hypothetical protein